MLQMFSQAPLRTVTLSADNGFEVTVADRGAALTSILVPVRGRRLNTVLAYADHRSYLDDPYYLGSTLGRYANRIHHGRLQLNGGSYQLVTDPAAGGHCLHGGPEGFHSQRWTLALAPDRSKLACRYISSHGEQGFPGRLDVAVEYRIVGDNALVIDYLASTDRATVVNMANHAYFNLNGDQSTINNQAIEKQTIENRTIENRTIENRAMENQTIGNHLLEVSADYYTPTDKALIPTGELAPVQGTAFDFRTPVRIGDRLAAGEGLDVNLVLDPGDEYIRHAATLRSPDSGVTLKLHTTQAGLQVYSGANLGAPFRPGAGICLEAQGFPDAPNKAGFPSTTLAAGETYRQRTVYEFTVEPV